MKNVLYVYGLGSSPDSTTGKLLNELLASYDILVFSIPYDQQNPEKGLSQIEDYIKNNPVDGIIGSSLGAFFTWALDVLIPRVLINPCMYPTVELPKLGISGEPFTELEAHVVKEYRTWPVNQLEDVICLFDDHDELFSYHKEFKMLYPSYTFHSAHKPDRKSFTPEVLEIIASKILKPLHRGLK